MHTLHAILPSLPSILHKMDVQTHFLQYTLLTNKSINDQIKNLFFSNLFRKVFNCIQEYCRQILRDPIESSTSDIA